MNKHRFNERATAGKGGQLALAAAVATAVLLAACGGGGETFSPPNPPPASPSTINGVAVPPDPGAAGATTVTGIDSDSNGIRDEVDRFLATKYGSNAAKLTAARTSAAALQRTLTADTSRKSAALLALQESADAGVCAGRTFRAAGANSSRELNEIFARTINTQARIAQRKALVESAGAFVRNIESVVCQ